MFNHESKIAVANLLEDVHELCAHCFLWRWFDGIELEFVNVIQSTCRRWSFSDITVERSYRTAAIDVSQTSVWSVGFYEVL